jgi:hypothetical protein
MGRTTTALTLGQLKWVAQRVLIAPVVSHSVALVRIAVPVTGSCSCAACHALVCQHPPPPACMHTCYGNSCVQTEAGTSIAHVVQQLKAVQVRVACMSTSRQLQARLPTPAEVSYGAVYAMLVSIGCCASQHHRGQADVESPLKLSVPQVDLCLAT